MTTTMKMTTKQKVLARVAELDGVTSVGMIAGDLGLTIETVRKHVKALISEGFIEIGWDGTALALTLEERRTRQAIYPMDALVQKIKDTACNP